MKDGGSRLFYFRGRLHEALALGSKRPSGIYQVRSRTKKGTKLGLTFRARLSSEFRLPLKKELLKHR